ncbi:MAG: DUF5110 domain-containing protein, partial [Anaerolineae bacterium]|nr:DUF5110 domain-containing protein [Anaerolineae bacterium]
MARRAAADSLPLIEPMYYDYPEAEEAYRAPHQYLFGSELIAAPFVNPADETTGLSKQVVWLPEGEWYHFFTGEHYKGYRWQPVYGRLADIPLFAKAGAIVPLAVHSFDAAVTNPAELHVHVFAGADNSFTLYEDDGATIAYEQGHACQTTFTQGCEDNRLSFSIDPAEGDTSLIPSVRTYQLLIHGVKAAVELAVTVDGKALAVETTYDAEKETLCLAGIELGVDSALELTLTAAEGSLLSQRDRKTETILRMLKFFKLNTGVRNHMAANLNLIMSDPKKLAPYTLLMSETQARALCEILFDAGLHVIHDTVAPTLLLLWNNQDQQSMRFRYSDAYLFFGMVQSINHDEGVMPRSQAIIPPINRWSHGAQDEIVHRTQWQAQIDYPDILTVLESYREVSP